MAKLGSTTDRVMLLVTRGGDDTLMQATWGPIAQAWPDAFEAPEVRHVSIEELIAGAGDLDDVASIVVGPGAKHQAQLLQVLDVLSEEHIPVVLLITEDDAAAPGGAPVSGDDLVVLPAESDPGMVATLLEGMSCRAGVVDQLEKDVHLAQRFHGGLRGEMDKIHEELQLAASVQREFLPKKIPLIDNIDINVLFRPCGYVSGDIYDVQRLDDDRLCVFVADVVGHGVPAAMMTMVLCKCLTTKINESGAEEILSPSEVLQSMNLELIRRHSDTPRFATAVYAIINGRTREVRMAGAGHPHPLRIKANGEIRPVPTEGGLLGIFPEDSFDEVSFTLDPDEMLVIYSDGFETAFPSDRADEYGRRVPNRHYVSRFEHVAEIWWSQGLKAAIAKLEHEIDKQSGSLHQVDDLTAMFIVPTVETALMQLTDAADRHMHGTDHAAS